MPTTTSRPPCAAATDAAGCADAPGTAVLLLAAVTLLLALAAAPAGAGAVPSTILPGAADGGAVALEPAVLRSDEGRAELDVVLGADAPGDVVVDLALAEAEVAGDGTVTAGPPTTSGRITSGGRLRPGEVLRATLRDATEPLVVVATVRPATSQLTSPGPAGTDADDGTDGSGGTDELGVITLAAVVLPGAVGPPPTAAIEEVDGELRGTITSTSPLLVTAVLRGDSSVTHPDRLVLPDQPVSLTGTAAGWPAPSELVVTDEAGRSTSVSTGGAALVVIAVALVLAAAIGVGLLVARHRRGAPAV